MAEESSMEAIRFLEDTKNVNWDYDNEADTLYMSISRPREAIHFQ
jgi:hypothetical protein